MVQLKITINTWCMQHQSIMNPKISLEILSFVRISDNLQQLFLIRFQNVRKNWSTSNCLKRSLFKCGAKLSFRTLWKCSKNDYLQATTHSKIFTLGWVIPHKWIKVNSTYISRVWGLHRSYWIKKFIKPHNLLLINDHDQNWAGISKYKMVLFYRIQ